MCQTSTLHRIYLGTDHSESIFPAFEIDCTQYLGDCLFSCHSGNSQGHSAQWTVLIAPDDKIAHNAFGGMPRYLNWMAGSQSKHGVEPTFNYTVSAYLSGSNLASRRTLNEKHFDYAECHADHVLVPAREGEILLHDNNDSIDDIQFGHNIPDMYNFTDGDEIYNIAADSLKAQIDQSFRTREGGFYHHYPVYIDQMWPDGIYMLDVFYARWTDEFQPENTTAWDDIALQSDLMNAPTQVDGGLPVHGFEWSS